MPLPEPEGRCRSFLFGLLAVVWMGVIFWVSSGPVPSLVPDPLVDFMVKKGGHFSAYGLLAALLWLALRDRVTLRLALIAAFAISAGYAEFDELHQAFTATRDPSVLDVGIDAFGAATGLWLVARRVASSHRSARSG